VFALGRAQELCILLDTYWERMNLNVPIYFSAGLTEKSIQYYKLFISWTSQSVKQTHVKRNAFDFKHIETFDRGDLDKPGPCVLFATPGMLHAGTSLEAFKHWAPNPKNLLIIPGYCVVGTVGSRLTAGFQGPVEIDGRNTVEVRCGIAHVSFSAHADAKGIMQLLRQAEPSNVVLVHGEKKKMGFLREKIRREFGIPCFDPANGQYIQIQASTSVPIKISTKLLQNAIQECQVSCSDEAAQKQGAEHRSKRLCTQRGGAFGQIPVTGVMVLKDKASPELMVTSDAAKEAQIPEHFLTLSCTLKLTAKQIAALILHLKQNYGLDTVDDDKICIKSVELSTPSSAPFDSACELQLSWAFEDDGLAQEIIAMANKTTEPNASKI